MSEFEICQYFKFAKDKINQVKILSELNLVKTEVILNILVENGMDVSVVTDKFGGIQALRRVREELDNLILDYYTKVGTVKQISILTGYSYSYIQLCLNRLKKEGKITEEMEMKHKEAPKLNGLRAGATQTSTITSANNSDNTNEEGHDTKRIEEGTPKAAKVAQISESDGQLRYQSTYERIESILKLKNQDDSDEIKQGFSELAITIFRDALNNDK